MKFSRIAAAIIAAAIVLTGCQAITDGNNQETEQDTNSQITNNQAVNAGYKRSRDPITIAEAEPVLYTEGERALVTAKGHVYGSVAINKVVKLGIWDWYNRKAVALGIKTSYGVNCNIDMTQLVQSQNEAIITTDVSIVDGNGTALTEYCNVGWSGFSETAELYGSTTSQNVEVGMQPISLNIPLDAMLRINLYDAASDTTFDPVYFDLAAIKNASKGASIREVKDSVTVKCINEAVYKITFTRAEMNTRKCSGSSNSVDLYDLIYTVKYRKEPQNSRVVSIFDSFDENKISPNIAFSVISDNDSTNLYDVVKDAIEVTDKRKEYNYVTSKQSFSKGEGYVYKTNRRIPSNTTKATDYVRILVEFPEERAARTDEEMIDFNARYCVYQIKLSDYVTPRHEDIFGG